MEFYQASLVDEEWSISPDAMYTETLNSVANTRTSAANGGRWSTTDTYQVKVYGLNSYDEELLLTTEIISFSTL